MGAGRHQPRTLAVLTGWGKLSGPTEFLIVPAGRPCNLSEEHIAIARDVSQAGGALPTIATACRVPLRTVERWFQQGKEGTGSQLHESFWRAIQDGYHLAEIKAIKKVTESAEPRDAQWWLTHHPMTRETWSDAAAERRTERRVIGDVVLAITAAKLPPEQERTILLQLQARGLGVPKEN